jgi:hypothetical protein
MGAEIQRLKGWSDVFHKSLGSEPSVAETKRLYSIFEQLAKIGGTFGTWRSLKNGIWK